MRKRHFHKQIAAVMALCVLTVATVSGAPAVAAPLSVPNPLNGGADPSLVYFEGSYYLATTRGDRIGIWKSASLAGLPSAPETVVWRDGDPSRNQQVWAPAMHRIHGPEGIRWYIYYTASNGVDANHRMYVLESAGDNPLGPYHFKARLADFGEYAIDGEPFGHNGRLYFAWSGPGRGMGGPAQIYLSAMSNPWTTSGGRVALPASGGCNEVREGASFLHRHGRTFLVYSTCDTGKPDYQLWMKSLPAHADPLNVGNWTQHAGPIFSRNDAAGVFGPGHNSFFRSPDGTEDWIAYHAKTSSAYTYEGRTTRAQRISWNADGTPNLGRPLPIGATHPLPSGDLWSRVPGPVFHQIRNTDGTWTGFAALAGAGTPTAAIGRDVAISGMPDGSAQVLIIGADSGVYHQTRNTDASWTGFVPLAGSGTPLPAKGSDVAITAMPDGTAQILIIGADSGVYHQIHNTDGTWTGFLPVAGLGTPEAAKASDIAIAGMPDGSTQVLIIGYDNVVYHQIRNADGSWTGFAPLSGAGTPLPAKGSRVAIAGMPDGSAQVLIIGADGGVYHQTRNTDGSWSGFVPLAGAGTPLPAKGSDVAITAMPDGSAQILIIGAVGGVYHQIRGRDGAWSGFVPVAGSGTPETARGGRVAISGSPDGAAHLFIVGQ